MSLPLDDLHVVDLSSGLAAGVCAKLLAQYGARLTKVEPPGGDPLRAQGPFLDDEPGPDRSLLFAWLYAGAESVVLDVDDAAGVEALRGLLSGAAILLDSEPPGRMRARGLDQPTLEASLPDLVCTSITPFGLDGPYADYAATPAVLHALGGWVHPMGETDRPPVAAGAAQGLVMTGVFGAIGTLQAIAAVDEVGGQAVEVAAQEVIAATMIYDTVSFQYLGAERPRSGRWLLPGAPNLGLYRARDGWCGVQAPLSWQLRNFYDLMDRPELAEDARFRSPESRAEHAEELDAIIGEWASGRDAFDIYHSAQARRLPFHPIPTAEEVYASPQLAARDYWDRTSVAGLTAAVPGLPFRLSGSLEQGRTLSAAPALGEHTQETLRAAGLPAAALRRVTEASDA